MSDKIHLNLLEAMNNAKDAYFHIVAEVRPSARAQANPNAVVKCGGKIELFVDSAPMAALFVYACTDSILLISRLPWVSMIRLSATGTASKAKYDE